MSASSGSRNSKKPTDSIAKTSKQRPRRNASQSSSGSAKSGSETLHLNDDWNEFLRVLTSTGTRYLLIGGHALAVHAEPRFTEDLDVFVQPSLSNAKRLRAALVEFGFGSVMPEAAELAKLGLVWMLGRKPRRIDILTGISGVTFAEAERGSVEVTLGEPASEGEQGAEPGAAAAWSAEIRRRIDEIEAGAVPLDDLDTVRARLEAASRP